MQYQQESRIYQREVAFVLTRWATRLLQYRSFLTLISQSTWYKVVRVVLYLQERLSFELKVYLRIYISVDHSFRHFTWWQTVGRNVILFIKMQTKNLNAYFHL